MSAPARPKAGRRIRETVRPMYDLLIGDPLREGRLRLDGAPPWVRQIATLGVIGLLGLLASLLATDIWRRGELLHLSGSEGRLTFVPVAVVPLTLVALALAWWLVSWGALGAAPGVGIAVAVMFLLVHAAMSRIPVVEFGGERHLAPLMVRTGYFLLPGTLLVSGVVRLVSSAGRRIAPYAFGLAAAGVVAFFGGQIWAHGLQLRNAVSPTVPFTLESTIRAIQILTLPLLTVGAVGIIEFGRGIAAAAAVPMWRSRVAVARSLLLGLVVVKLWIQLGRHTEEWLASLSHRPAVAATTVAVLAALCAGAWWSLRVPRSPASAERGRERLVYLGALALVLPGLAILIARTLGDFFVTQLSILSVANGLRDVPFARWASYADAAFFLAILVGGVILLRRRRDDLELREIAVGMVLLGAWAGAFFLFELLRYEPATNIQLLDMMLTATVGVLAVLRWWRTDVSTAIRLIALVLFSWLVLTEGDFIAILGVILGLPGVFVVIFGTLFALAASSGFASGDTSRFPRPSRPLLWVGYMLVSVTIVHWMAATHSSSVTEDVGGRAFFYVGIPMAVWLLTRMPFAPPGTASPEGPGSS